MSFDIYFVPSRESCQIVERRNPLANELESVRILDAESLAAVAATLTQHGAKKTAEAGLVLSTRDGGRADVFLTKESCMFAVRSGLTPNVAALLFDVLRAGQWLMFAASGEDVIAATEADAEILPEDAGAVRIAHSADDIVQLLHAPLEQWDKIREKVVG
jgi:hypothetical protein